jgi:hypothetical protein
MNLIFGYKISLTPRREALIKVEEREGTECEALSSNA